MARRFHTLIWLLMFGLFLSNNLVVPVHELSHIHEDHPSDLANCDVFHAAPSVALLSTGYSAFLPSDFRSLQTSANQATIVLATPLTTPIRAPPAHA